MKKIGEIKGVPVVEGDANLVKDQILYKETDKGISLSKRTNGKLEEVSGGNNNKEGSKLYYYSLDVSKFKYDNTYVLTHLNFLNVNSFALPSMGSKGNCFYNISGSDSSMITWSSIVENFILTPPKELESFPIVYITLNEVSEITVINNDGKNSIIAKGNIIEQFNTFDVFFGYGLFKELSILFTEITKEEYEAMITYKPE